MKEDAGGHMLLPANQWRFLVHGCGAWFWQYSVLYYCCWLLLLLLLLLRGGRALNRGSGRRAPACSAGLRGLPAPQPRARAAAALGGRWALSRST